MPWCPKCKTEYREGFTVCADCGGELVEQEPEKDSEEEIAEESGEDAAWKTGQNGAVRLQAAEGSEGSEDGNAAEEDGGHGTDGEAAADMDGMSAGRQRRAGGTGLYQDSSERASDNRSSAWMLLGLGIAGLVVVVLGAAGVLPLRLGNPYLFFGVMGAIFILFVVAGIVSMKNAKFFDKKAESENTLRQTLLDWCDENLRAEEIDAAVCATGVSDEIAYFRRFSCIKEKLNRQFVNLNQGFLDQFIDDYIYDKIFGERAE